MLEKSVGKNWCCRVVIIENDSKDCLAVCMTFLNPLLMMNGKQEERQHHVSISDNAKKICSNLRSWTKLPIPGLYNTVKGCSWVWTSSARERLQDSLFRQRYRITKANS